MTQLEPCPHCHRHVKVSETACPFCAAAIDLSKVAPRAIPGAFLGRAAVFAIGVAAAGCGDNEKRTIPTHDAASVPKDAAPVDTLVTPDADPDAGSIAIYSAAPTDASRG